MAEMDKSSMSTALKQDWSTSSVGAERTSPGSPTKLGEAPPLSDFLRCEWPSLHFREKCNLVRDLALCLAERHRDGRRHPELSAARFKIGPNTKAWQIRFTGPSKRTFFPRPLAKDKRVAELAELYASLLPGCGRATALRFLRFYLAGDNSELRDWERSVRERAWKMARARWRRQGRMALGDNAHFAREKKAGFTIYRRRDSTAEEALAFLLPDPDRVLEQGEIMPGRGNSCVAAKVDIGGRLYILKKYHCRGWIYRLRHVFRRSRALRVWRAAWDLRRIGLPLPEPCLCLEERKFRLLGNSYILTEFFAGSVRLSEIYAVQSSNWRRTLLVRMGILLGRLHRFRAIHGDTNWDNILVRPQGNDFTLALVDLDGSRLLAGSRPARAARDVWHFVRDMKRRGGDLPQEIDFFLRCWSRWAGWKTPFSREYKGFR